MKFFTHENFPYAAGVILRAFDGRHEFEFFHDTYPPGTPDNEWIKCLGKQSPKPTILRLGSALVKNHVSRNMLREAGCRFVCFADGWSKKPMTWEKFAFKLLQFWPKICDELAEIDGLMILEVGTSGKTSRIPL